MSEFELGLLRQRARAAYLQKARRGYALWQVPVGFVRSDDERIEMTPDRQVQQSIAMVFTKFRELGSANQTLFWLREQKLLLPHAKPGTDGREIGWQMASLSRVHQTLSNPCYAGTFAYGRTAVRNVISDGRMRRSATRSIKPMEQWQILLVDHHPGYQLVRVSGEPPTHGKEPGQTGRTTQWCRQEGPGTALLPAALRAMRAEAARSLLRRSWRSGSICLLWTPRGTRLRLVSFAGQPAC